MLSCSSVILQTRISIQRLVSGKFIFPIVTKIDRHSIAARSLTRCVDRFFASISVVDINIVLQIRLIFLIAHRSVDQRVGRPSHQQARLQPNRNFDVPRETSSERLEYSISISVASITASPPMLNKPLLTRLPCTEPFRMAVASASIVKFWTEPVLDNRSVPWSTTKSGAVLVTTSVPVPDFSRPLLPASLAAIVAVVSSSTVIRPLVTVRV